jgi:hypothetical protein
VILLGVDECDGCDQVQLLDNAGYTIELHHLIPDDGAPHVPEPDCGCTPRLEWLQHDLAVVEHADQDLDLRLDT